MIRWVPKYDLLHMSHTAFHINLIIIIHVQPRPKEMQHFIQRTPWPQHMESMTMGAKRAILLKIGKRPTSWTKFTPRLSLCQIPNGVCGVEYLHANT